MRDEVLGEWKAQNNHLTLYIYCHVSGGVIFGWAGLRFKIFRAELPLALKAIRFGDRTLFDIRPELDDAPILVHFRAKQACYAIEEKWGTLKDYRT